MLNSYIVKSINVGRKDPALTTTLKVKSFNDLPRDSVPCPLLVKLAESNSELTVTLRRVGH